MSNEQDLTDPHVEAVTAAVAKLFLKLGPEGFSSEAIFEGAIRGGAVQLIASTGCSAGDVAVLLDEIADVFREDGANVSPSEH